jgi:exo-beta-1,3-glucanase (GH17 family)
MMTPSDATTLSLAAPATRLPCVSYAPFRRQGHTPFDPTRVVSPAQIEEDLRIIAPLSGCIRTYGLDHGLDAVPEIARRLGLRVMLGAWIGRDAQANERELEQALALANDYADVVDLLIVGNEVMLRRELTATALAELLQQAQASSLVPVTYADVWEFWLQHQAVLVPHVDVVTVHVLPYWEDEPVALAKAVDHIHTTTAHVRERLLVKRPVFVGETGWPAAGRQRGPAVPGVAQQTQFIRELAARLPADPALPIGVNVIEAFDQPWKRQLEGAMGGYWGLWDAQGQPRVTLAGPMPGAMASTNSFIHASAWRWALGAGSVCMLVFWVLGTRQPRPRSVWVIGLAGGALVGLALQSQLLAASLWVRDGWTWATHAAVIVLGLVGSVVALLSITAPDTDGPAHGLRPSVWMSLLMLGMVLTLPLAVDGRYRPLVWPLAWVAVALWLLAWVRGQPLHGATPAVRGLSAVLLLASCYVLGLEGVHNAEAWWAMGLGLALAVMGLSSGRMRLQGG